MLKYHSLFMEQVGKAIDGRLPSIKDEVRKGIVDDVLWLSSKGVLPEGWAPSDVLAMPAPIPPPPILAIPPKPTEHSTVSIGSSGYKLSHTSLKKLDSIRPELTETVLLAIDYSLVDFGVGQGARTFAEQQDAMRRGTTRTMKSKHLPDANGIVNAVDLWAYVDGKVSWDFDYYYYIARAMDRAATELGYANHIRWGAVWDRVLSDFGVIAAQRSETLQGGAYTEGYKQETRRLYLAAVEEYKRRHAGSDFLDGPHFEWVA